MVKLSSCFLCNLISSYISVAGVMVLGQTQRHEFIVFLWLCYFKDGLSSTVRLEFSYVYVSEFPASPVYGFCCVSVSPLCVSHPFMCLDSMFVSLNTLLSCVTVFFLPYLFLSLHLILCLPARLSPLLSSPCVSGLRLSVSCFILRVLCHMLSVFSFASSCPIKSNSFQLFSHVFPLPWFPTCVCIYCVSFHLSFIGASVNLLIVLPCVF